MPAVIVVEGTEALARRLLELGADAPRAATRAINRTLSTVNTATVRALAAEVGLAAKDIRPALRIDRATFSRQIGTLMVTGRRIPLAAFGARGPEPSRGRGAGVTYRLPGGRGLVPGGFIATMRSGHRGVFARHEALGPNRPGRPRRSGAAGILFPRVGRKPIVEQFGPSLPGAMVRKGIDTAMQRLADDALRKNLEHEIAWILTQRAQAGDGTEA